MSLTIGYQIIKTFLTTTDPPEKPSESVRMTQPSRHLGAHRAECGRIRRDYPCPPGKPRPGPGRGAIARCEASFQDYLIPARVRTATSWIRPQNPGILDVTDTHVTITWTNRKDAAIGSKSCRWPSSTPPHASCTEAACASRDTLVRGALTALRTLHEGEGVGLACALPADATQLPDGPRETTRTSHHPRA